MQDRHKIDKNTLRWWEKMAGALGVGFEKHSGHMQGKKQQRKKMASRAGRRARKAKRKRARLSRRHSR